MIEFYNRQANHGIRADPTECIIAMRERGIEALKESQIKSWWSTYHQKRKREMERMEADVQNAVRNVTCNVPQLQPFLLVHLPCLLLLHQYQIQPLQ